MSLLAAAYLRIARGREHLAELENLNDEVCDAYADRLSAFYPASVPHPTDLVDLFDRTHPEPSVPPQVAILVGEIVYNYRAALDYLVCTLSKVDAPAWQGQRRNQFPIESTRRGFDGRRHTFLAGLSAAHVAIIERYQPYAGCQWTRRLASLSNRDKHNDLIVVAQGLQLEIKEAQSEGDAHQFIISLHLTLRDGTSTPVTGVLQNLGDDVTKVLEQFPV